MQIWVKGNEKPVRQVSANTWTATVVSKHANSVIKGSSVNTNTAV